MIVESDLKELQRLGLTERESKVYLALVEQGPILPLEIQSITSIQRSKIYETLHSLLQRGFILERPVQKKKLYEAVRPDEVIKQILLERGREMDQFQVIGQQLEPRLSLQFEEAYRGRDAQDYFTFLQNPAQIIRIWDELHSGAEAEILTFHREPYIYPNNEENPEVVNKIEMEALARGVRYRAIYQAKEVQHHQDWLRTMVMPRVQAGEEARVFPGLAIKLTIFDRRVSYFGFIDETHQQRITAILIENRGIAAAFVASFEYHWQASTPLDEFLRLHAK
jgi:sugar-specific transcriptional regulator TrmB